MTNRKLSLLDGPALLTRTEAAERLRCSTDTVDRRIRTGKLKAVRDGGLVRISIADLNAYIREAKRWR